MNPSQQRMHESAQHAVEVHLSSCLMFEETKWRRTVTNEPRDRMIERAVRDGCDALIAIAQERRDKPLAHDYNPE